MHVLVCPRDCVAIYFCKNETKTYACSKRLREIRDRDNVIHAHPRMGRTAHWIRTVRVRFYVFPFWRRKNLHAHSSALRHNRSLCVRYDVYDVCPSIVLTCVHRNADDSCFTVPRCTANRVSKLSPVRREEQIKFFRFTQTTPSTVNVTRRDLFTKDAEVCGKSQFTPLACIIRIAIVVVRRSLTPRDAYERRAREGLFLIFIRFCR